MDNPAGDATEGGAGAGGIGGGHGGSHTHYTHLQPRQRSWLFALPPYIRDVDLAREVIVLSNPEARELDLTGHYIVDRARAHRYDFEDGYTLPPLADVHSAWGFRGWMCDIACVASRLKKSHLTPDSPTRSPLRSGEASRGRGRRARAPPSVDEQGRAAPSEGGAQPGRGHGHAHGRQRRGGGCLNCWPNHGSCTFT